MAPGWENYRSYAMLQSQQHLPAKLSVAARREYWSTIFRAYKAMYASASAPAATMEDEERAEQLVAQTEEVVDAEEEQQPARLEGAARAGAGPGPV